MSKVWCANIECKYNENNRCKSKEIRLSDGMVHTVFQGFMQYWLCASYEESIESAKLRKEFDKLLFKGSENNE